MASWGVSDIPAQNGALVAITGATGGLGYQMALALARAGAEIILIGRDAAKGAIATRRIMGEIGGATVVFEKADLADLGSVRDAAARLSQRDRPLDILINNAGLMSPPKRKTTVDGFEIQFGTNHLGHFLLTSLLLPLLRRSPRPRVVTVSSLTHRTASIDFDDLQAQKKYVPFRSYGQSKLCNLLFAVELQRHSDAGRWGLMSNAAHPGAARTDLIANGPGEGGFIQRLLFPLVSHSDAAGALPILFAATSPSAKPAGYYGPDGLLELKGAPRTARMSKNAKDSSLAGKLWAISTALTDAKWP